jgi:MFS family permease
VWLSAGYFFLFLGASHQQFLIVYLRDVVGWSDGSAQALLGSVYATFMVWRLLVGWTLRIGDYLSILLGALTYPLFALVVWAASFAAHSPWWVGVAFLGAALWGWGAASMWLASGSVVLDAAKRSRYGAASGVFHAAPNFGFALGVFLFDSWLRAGAGTLGAHRSRLLVTAAAMGIGCMCLAAIPRHGVLRDSRVGGALRFMRHPSLRIASFLMASSSIGFGLMLSVFPDFVQGTMGGSLLGTAAFFPLARGVLSLTGSPFSDRWGRGAVLFVSFAVGAAGVALAALLPSVWTAGLAALLLGVLGGVVPPVASALVGDVAGSASRPLALGAVFFWRDFGVVLVFALSVTRALGALRADARTLFGGFASLFVLCACLSAALMRREATRVRPDRDP